jgi:chorismate synthase
VRDYRGGGRQSARETAARVAAGAVARLILPGVTIRGAVVQIGPHAVAPDRIDFSRTETNPFWAPDPDIVPVWEEHLETIRKAGSSTGAIVAVEAVGAPAGWGAPVYGKLDAELAGALMSINAAKGVEIGAGFAAAALTGEENADEMRAPKGKGGADAPVFLSNSAGGVLGGISTGQPITARVAFKPTSSILTPRRTINEAGEEIELRTKGRHDPCVGIRAVPVVEAMVACVLADAFLRHRGQTGRG